MKILICVLACLSILSSKWGIGVLFGMLCISLVLYIEANLKESKMSIFGKIMITMSVLGVLLSVYFIGSYLYDSKPLMQEFKDVYKCSIETPLYYEV